MDLKVRRDENGNPKKSPLSLQLNLSKFNASMFEKATEEEKRQQDVMSESATFFKDGMKKLFKNPLAVENRFPRLVYGVIHSCAQSLLKLRLSCFRQS